MRKVLNCFLVVIVIGGIFLLVTRNEDIVAYGVRFFTANEETKKPIVNEYYKDYTFDFVQNVETFKPNSKDDLYDIIYTGLNSGAKEFYFYCSNEYETCLDDVNSIANDATILSVINNLVHPFNSYNKLYIETNQLGKVVIKLDKLYSSNDIEVINEKLDLIEKEVITDKMEVKDKIKTMHDYLINHAVYDSERADNIKAGTDTNPKYDSHKATGPLIQGITLCSGYSDAMKIYLDRLNIPNYKIANNEHIWNLVYIDNKWLHIDLTWDDPVTKDKQNILLDTFFLIDTKTLMETDPTSHTFNEEYYSEAKA